MIRPDSKGLVDKMHARGFVHTGPRVSSAGFTVSRNRSECSRWRRCRKMPGVGADQGRPKSLPRKASDMSFSGKIGRSGCDNIADIGRAGDRVIRSFTLLLSAQVHYWIKACGH